MAVHVTRTGVALTVGIIILAAAAFGALYVIQGQGEQARRQEAIQVAEEQLQAEANDEVALNDGDTDTSTSGTDTTGAENTDTSTETPAETVTELPQTGPADGLLTALLAGAVTFVVVSYGTSGSSIRRALGLVA